MADALSQADRALTINTPFGDDAVIAVSFNGREALSEPFAFVVDLVSEDQALKVESILGKSVTVELKLDDDYDRYFNGIVWRFASGLVSDFEDAPIRHYQAELVPWTQLLKLNSNCRIFQEQTIPQIVEQVFQDGGYTDYKLSLNETYTKQDYCVQYNESDHDFISRLLEREGIFYYFSHEDSKHTLVLGDAASAYVNASQSSVEYYDTFDDRVTGQLKSWVRRQECTTSKFQVNDYNFETPTTALKGEEKTVVSTAISDTEKYEYAPNYQQASDGKTLATARIEAEEALYDRAEGGSYHPLFQPGSKFKITEHPVDAEKNQGYVVTAVEHHAHEPVLFASGAAVGAQDQPLYWNNFECAPDKTAVRPQRKTPKPAVHGPHTAVVVGPENSEIYTNEYGQIKVQFHWDEEGKFDENSSCWMRVTQGWAGGKFAAQFLPRVGNEVIVEYLNGDVDRPIITGSVYNADNKPIYDLPDNSYQSGVKTLSTDKGTADNYNELRFSDKIGEEEIYFHAERDFNREVENNDTLKVGFDTKDPGDQTIDIYNNRTVTLDQGDDSLTITNGGRTVQMKADHSLTIDEGDQSVTISSGGRTVQMKADDSLTIDTGDHSINVSAGQSTIEAAQSITLKVGGSSVKIDMQGVTIDAPQINISGSAEVNVQGAMASVQADGILTLKGAMVNIN